MKMLEQRIIRRVLMTADTVGGVWTYATELCRALGRYEVEVALATMGGPPSAEQVEEIKQIENVLFFPSSYKLEWMDDPWRDVMLAGEWLLDLENELQPDVVHLNGFVHGALPWATPLIVVGHSSVLSWWNAVKGESAPKEWDRYAKSVARGLHAADMVVAPSGAMLTALRSNYGTFLNDRVIYNGRTIPALQPTEKKDLVLGVGRLWDEAKNINLLDQAAADLPWPVYVAGDDRHPSGGVSQFDHVVSLGQLGQEDLQRWLAQASIFAHPARYEPFGLCALEAAIAGCALILGDIASLREIWQDAVMYIAPEDAGGLHQAIQRLINNPGERVDLGKKAQERARVYTADRMAFEYLRAYYHVLSPDRAGTFEVV